MLSVVDVTAAYGATVVLQSVSLRVEPGEVFVVLGPNGAGKSSLLRAVMALVPRIDGDIEGPGGKRLSKLSTWQIARAGVAYVPEGRGILNSLTVDENLRLGASLLHLRHAGARVEQQMHRVLERFPQLRERLAVRAGLLSGGQQQMLSLARALIGKPRVLLLDEPSLGLAPLIRGAIADHLRDIARSEGLAVLLAEQDVSLAQRCGSRGVVLRRGRIVAMLGARELADREALRRHYLVAPAGAAERTG